MQYWVNAIWVGTGQVENTKKAQFQRKQNLEKPISNRKNAILVGFRLTTYS